MVINIPPHIVAGFLCILLVVAVLFVLYWILRGAFALFDYLYDRYVIKLARSQTAQIQQSIITSGVVLEHNLTSEMMKRIVTTPKPTEDPKLEELITEYIAKRNIETAAHIKATSDEVKQKLNAASSTFEEFMHRSDALTADHVRAGNLRRFAAAAIVDYLVTKREAVTTKA